MDRLGLMRSFRRVAELGSFSAAARDLGLSNAVISKHVALLEGHLGARLINRTTRRQSLTEAGAAYYPRAVRVLEELGEAEDAVGRMQAAPRGTLKVNAPMSFGVQHLAPVLPLFLQRYPEISVELNMNDRVVDLMEEGFDLALRIRSGLPNSRQIAQKIARARRLLAASPDYLAKRGPLERPADLAHHDCLIYSLTDSPALWDFDGPEGAVAVAVTGRMRANNGQALRDAALAGLGVVRLPVFTMGEALAEGLLLPVMPRYRVPAHELYAVYPSNRNPAPKLRAFIDFLAEQFTGEPWEKGVPG
jgi:DNA-binding transcriptional LysR family regulator